MSAHNDGKRSLRLIELFALVAWYQARDIIGRVLSTLAFLLSHPYDLLAVSDFHRDQLVGADRPANPLEGHASNTIQSSKVNSPASTGWDDRRPAPLADEGTVLPWSSMKSVFNAQSIFTVMRSAQMTGTALGGAYENDSLEASEAALLTHLNWPKRPALHLLTFTDAVGGELEPRTSSQTIDISGCTTPTGSSLRLDTLLAEGVDIPSQVYKCTVLPQGYTVVLKLLTDQVDKMPYDLYLPPEVYEQCDLSKASLGRNAQMSLSREADMFKSVAALQGTVIPYSYGFYPFQLPDGTGVVGHVQEWIQSVDIETRLRAQMSNGSDDVDRFFTSIFESYILLHSRDVAHQDIAVRNLLLDPNEEALRFVIVDLTMAVPISYCEKTRQAWACAEEVALHQCLEEELDGTAFFTWLRSERGKHMKELFCSGPSKLAQSDVCDVLPNLSWTAGQSSGETSEAGGHHRRSPSAAQASPESRRSSSPAPSLPTVDVTNAISAISNGKKRQKSAQILVSVRRSPRLAAKVAATATASLKRMQSSKVRKATPRVNIDEEAMHCKRKRSAASAFAEELVSPGEESPIERTLRKKLRRG